MFWAEILSDGARQVENDLPGPRCFQGWLDRCVNRTVNSGDLRAFRKGAKGWGGKRRGLRSSLNKGVAFHGTVAVPGGTGTVAGAETGRVILNGVDASSILVGGIGTY